MASSTWGLATADVSPRVSPMALALIRDRTGFPALSQGMSANEYHIQICFDLRQVERFRWYSQILLA
jgi:hypothetical protein